MSQARPLTPKSSPYITVEGYQKLERELKDLWVRRADVTLHLSAAAAEGDRSENAEYIYRKKELREIDRRIRYLQKRLPTLKLVDRLPENNQKVFFGAWITLERQDGKQSRYRIVGADETDARAGLISIDSPMSRALLKKEIHEEVRVKTPTGETLLTITEISYSSPNLIHENF